MPMTALENLLLLSLLFLGVWCNPSRSLNNVSRDLDERKNLGE